MPPSAAVAARPAASAKLSTTRKITTSGSANPARFCLRCITIFSTARLEARMVSEEHGGLHPRLLCRAPRHRRGAGTRQHQRDANETVENGRRRHRRRIDVAHEELEARARIERCGELLGGAALDAAEEPDPTRIAGRVAEEIENVLIEKDR